MRQHSLHRCTVLLVTLVAACAANPDTGDPRAPVDAGRRGKDGAAFPMRDATATDGARSESDGGSGDGCPEPPAGATPEQRTALRAVNALRRGMGISCLTMVQSLNDSASRHCAYYAQNRLLTTCVMNPNAEISTCMGFTGATYTARMTAAGYMMPPASEVMHFLGDPQVAVSVWVNSVWHRGPLLSPWTRDVGYGRAEGCDTMDLGRGMAFAEDIVATYPYDGQEHVPATFNGREGPTPPAPPGGFPSGYPIIIYTLGTVTDHEIMVDGTTTPLAHEWLAPADPRVMGLLRNENVLYTHAPLLPLTRYRVHVRGMRRAGTAFDITFSFRTE